MKGQANNINVQFQQPQDRLYNKLLLVMFVSALYILLTLGTGWVEFSWIGLAVTIAVAVILDVALILGSVFIALLVAACVFLWSFFHQLKKKHYDNF